jgi:hypothetical protein
MALGLTDHVWSYREYSWLPVHTDPTLTKQMDDRIMDLLTPALQAQPQRRIPEKAASIEAMEEKKEEAVPMPKAV